MLPLLQLLPLLSAVAVLIAARRWTQLWPKVAASPSRTGIKAGRILRTPIM